MPAAVSPGGAPFDPAPDEGDPTSEPFLLEALLAAIQTLRARSAALARESAQEAQRHPGPAWEQLRLEVTSAHERADRALLAAARRDGIPLAAIVPRSSSGCVGIEDPVCRFRHWSRELEQQCASTLGQAGDLGLTQVSHALARWRRELIGLEQPLIAVNAQSGGSRRS